jgi:hypothetical protein
MTAIEVLDNLENYDLWDFKDYQLSKAECEVCKNALRYYAEKVVSMECRFKQAVANAGGVLVDRGEKD